jgi:hypothetical protein
MSLTTDTRTLTSLRRLDTELDHDLERGSVVDDGDREAAERFINTFSPAASDDADQLRPERNCS